MDLTDLLKVAVARKASDLHIKVGSPPYRQDRPWSFYDRHEHESERRDAQDGPWEHVQPLAAGRREHCQRSCTE